MRQIEKMVFKRKDGSYKGEGRNRNYYFYEDPDGEEGEYIIVHKRTWHNGDMCDNDSGLQKAVDIPDSFEELVACNFAYDGLKEDAERILTECGLTKIEPDHPTETSETIPDYTEVVVLVGLPGCGKSTYMREHLADHYRINLDSIHEFLEPETGFSKENLGFARSLETQLIEHKLKEGRSIVIDATNITAKHRERYVDFAQEYNAVPKAVCFAPDVERSIRQNRGRADAGGRDVPEDAIKRMADQFEAPQWEEGFYDNIVNVD